MWTNENRGFYDRSKLRYPSDLTDEEWALIEPLIPPAMRGGGKRTVNMREVVNALMYVLSTGCQWRGHSERPAATQYRAWLLGPLGLGWHARPYPPCSVREVPGASTAGGKPNGRDHRQPEREKCRTFVVLPKRWIVERTIGWLNRCRRLAKDWECFNRNALAFLRWASIRIMLRKLCRKTK